MTSRVEAPDTSAFLTAYEDALHGARGYRYSTRRGGRLDTWGGSSAVLFAQQAARLKAEFGQNYTDTATGTHLKRHVEKRYSVTPVLADYGYGTLVVARPAVGDPGTIYAGQRVLVRRLGSLAMFVVREDVLVLGTDLQATVPIRTANTGESPAITANATEIELDDAMFDPTFAPIMLVCSAGIADEKPADVVARGRAALASRAVGVLDSIERGCLEAGAEHIVALPGHAFGDAVDAKIAFVYVGDGNYSTSDELLWMCFLNLERYRTAGHDLQVRPMASQPVTALVTVYVTALVQNATQIALRGEIATVIADTFDRRTEFWLFDTQSLAGAASRVVQSIARNVVVTTTPSPPAATFPATLPRYTLRAEDVTVQFIKA